MGIGPARNDAYEMMLNRELDRHHVLLFTEPEQDDKLFRIQRHLYAAFTDVEDMR